MARPFVREELVQGPGFAFSMPSNIRFQDVDAAGIVFFARVFDLIHDAYVGFLEAAGSPLPQVLKTRAWAAPLAHAEADFLKPLRFGDAIETQLVAARAENSALTLGWRIVAGGAASVVAQSVHIFVEVATFARAPIPDGILSKLATVMKT